MSSQVNTDQGYLLSSMRDPLSFISNQKASKLIYPFNRTLLKNQHKSPKHDECPWDDDCRTPTSMGEKSNETTVDSLLLHSGTCSNTSEVEDMCTGASPRRNENVYKRRRKLKNPVDPLLEHAITSSVEGGTTFISSLSSDATKAHIVPVRVWGRDVLVNGNMLDSWPCCPQNPDSIHSMQIDENMEVAAKSYMINDSLIGEGKGCTEVCASDVQKSYLKYCSSENDSCSSSKSEMGHCLDFIKCDVDNITECSSSDIATEVLRKCYLEKESCDFTRPCASVDIVGIGADASGSISCKICCQLDNPLKMLICDLCEEGFHLSCCNPRITRLRFDEWYCQPCSRKKPKSLFGIIASHKSLNTVSKQCRRKALRSKCGPISFMFEDTEPYTTGVRIGKAFQADVPDWSGPISEDSYIFGQPLELDPMECVSPNGWTCNQSNKHSSIGNWIQCREVINEDKRVICGKWRRAPLFEVQTNDWDCSCAVLWDPIHSDCAVPQELPTDEVMMHQEYIKVLRPRLAGKKWKQTQI